MQAKQVIPVDYSAPNVAKEMHVGHLRTTVVGDALVRTLEHLGHDVVRQNHVGDWGTPFGMLIEHLLAVGEDSPDAQLLVTDPNTFYAAAREEFDGDAEFADRARSSRRRAAGRRPRHAAALGRARRALQAVLQPHLLDPRRHPDRRGPGRRVDVQRRARADLRRARGRGARDHERRRPVRVPRRLHRPRGQAGAAHHPQVRRRLRLRDHRPRDHQAPRPRPALRPDPLRHRGPAGPAPQHGLGHRPQGRLAARRRRGRARPDRQRARSRPQDPAHARGHPAQADGAARGGDRAGSRGGRRGAPRPRSRCPGGDRTTGRASGP